LRLSALLAIVLLMTTDTDARTIDARVERDLPRLVGIYEQLHAAPELSYREEQTAAFLAAELRRLRYEVTERVGKYDDSDRTSWGLVAMMKNGEGPLVMIRTDLDALPIEEQTGLPYASKVRSTNEAGDDVGVMHACGHDIHMTSFLGTAKMLAELKESWSGTLMLVGQPAEEMGAGATAMIEDGLYERFGTPDYIIGLHDNANLPAGSIGYVEGYALANVDSVEIVMRGVGGHGAYPHTTVDPVVMAAELVVSLQSIVSRERPPLEPAVVTVGSIHGGTKSNIIPDEVRLELTVRSYKPEVRKLLLDSIRRKAEAIAHAAGAPAERAPIVRPLPGDVPLNATWNDPELTARLAGVWRAALGEERVVKMEPVMGGEDFGNFSLGGKIPLMIFWLGAVDPEKYAAAKAAGRPLPSLHSSSFAPLPAPTIATGVQATTIAALELLAR
jgi:amidohydrolase